MRPAPAPDASDLDFGAPAPHDNADLDFAAAGMKPPPDPDADLMEKKTPTEGHYNLTKGGQDRSIPFSQVTRAVNQSRGYTFKSPQEHERFVRDYQAVTPPRDAGDLIERYLGEPYLPKGDTITGLARTGARGLGGMADLYDLILRADPVARGVTGPDTPENTADKQVISQHARDIGDWLKGDTHPRGFWEGVGAFGEQALEYMSGEGLLRLAGPAAKTAEAGAEVAPKAAALEEQLKNTQQIQSVLRKNPRLAGMVYAGAKAMQGHALVEGAKQGVQTYIHTGDLTQAATAAGLGYAMGTAGGAGSGINQYIQAVKPQQIGEGATAIPVLASQLNERGEPMPGRAGDTPPEMQAAQQVGAFNLIKSHAQNAVENVLNKLNATRQYYSQIINNQRLLPAEVRPAPVPPPTPTFTMDMTPPTPPTVPEGPTVQRAQPYEPGAQTEPELRPPATWEEGKERKGVWMAQGNRMGPQAFTTSAAEGAELAAQQDRQAAIDQATIDRLTDKFSKAAVSAKVRKTITPEEQQAWDQAHARLDTLKEQRAAAAKPQPAAEPSTATGGTVSTDNPAQATQWLSQLEEFQKSQAHGTLPKDVQVQLEDTRKNLADQLALHQQAVADYHAASAPAGRAEVQAARARFAPVNPSDVLPHVNDLGQAADQLKATVQPVLNMVEKEKKGAVSSLFAQMRAASRSVRLAEDNTGRAAALDHLHELNQQMDDLLTSSNLSRGDLAQARETMHHAMFLQEAHEVFESMMNGVTTEETMEKGLPKIMTGNAKLYQSWLNEKNNASHLASLIGEEGVTDLKRLSLAMSSAEDARQLMEVSKNVDRQIGKRTGHVGYGSLIGSMVGGVLGGHGGGLAGAGGGAVAGAYAGAFAEDRVRDLLRYAAQNPRVADAMLYAAQMGVDPKVYAPYIARMIDQPFQGMALRKQDAQRPASSTMAVPDPKGLVEAGNLPIWNRPVIQNANGSHSSELSFSREDTDDKGNTREVLVPSIVDGKFMTPDGKMPPLGKVVNGKYVPTPEEKAMQDKAWEHYKQTGEHLGKFDTWQNADAYADILHNREGAKK